MKRLLLSLILAGAMTGTAFAQGTPLAPNLPLNQAPQPGANPTANLIFNAMLATARANATNPQAAASANLSLQHAVQSYNLGDLTGAQSQATQALIDANRQAPTQIPVLQSTIPTTSALQTNPFLIPGGSVAMVDANEFVAQARGAVANCRATHSPNTNIAATNLAAAEQDAQAGKYLNVRTEARTAVDLCATPH